MTDAPLSPTQVAFLQSQGLDAFLPDGEARLSLQRRTDGRLLVPNDAAAALTRLAQAAGLAVTASVCVESGQYILSLEPRQVRASRPLTLVWA